MQRPLQGNTHTAGSLPAGLYCWLPLAGVGVQPLCVEARLAGHLTQSLAVCAQGLPEKEALGLVESSPET